MTFPIPFPQTTNHLFVNLKSGGRARSGAYKRWQREAGWTIRAAFAEMGFRGALPCFSGDVALRVDLVRRNMSADLDNTLKCIQDALVHLGLLRDDSQIVEIRARWRRPDEQEQPALVTLAPAARQGGW